MNYTTNRFISPAHTDKVKIVYKEQELETDKQAKCTDKEKSIKVLKIYYSPNKTRQSNMSICGED